MRTRIVLLFIIFIGTLSCSSAPTQPSDVTSHTKTSHHFVHHAPRIFDHIKNRSDI